MDFSCNGFESKFPRPRLITKRESISNCERRTSTTFADIRRNSLCRRQSVGNATFVMDVHEEPSTEDIERWKNWVGNRVTIGEIKFGVLRYFGQTEFASGIWCGVELDEPVGKNDGTVKGVRYFQCADKYGIFAPLSKTRKVSDNEMFVNLRRKSKLKMPSPRVRRSCIPSNVPNTLIDSADLNKTFQCSNFNSVDDNPNFVLNRTLNLNEVNNEKAQTDNLQFSANNKSLYSETTTDDFDVLNKTVILNFKSAQQENQNSDLNVTFSLLGENFACGTGTCINKLERRDSTFILDKSISEPADDVISEEQSTSMDKQQMDESLGILSLNNMQDFNSSIEVSPANFSTKRGISKNESCEDVMDLPEFEAAALSTLKESADIFQKEGSVNLNHPSLLNVSLTSSECKGDIEEILSSSTCTLYTHHSSVESLPKHDHSGDSSITKSNLINITADINNQECISPVTRTLQNSDVIKPFSPHEANIPVPLDSEVQCTTSQENLSKQNSISNIDNDPCSLLLDETLPKTSLNLSDLDRSFDCLDIIDMDNMNNIKNQDSFIHLSVDNTDSKVSTRNEQPISLENGNQDLLTMSISEDCTETVQFHTAFEYHSTSNKSNQALIDCDGISTFHSNTTKDPNSVNLLNITQCESVNVPCPNDLITFSPCVNMLNNKSTTEKNNKCSPTTNINEINLIDITVPTVNNDMNSTQTLTGSFFADCNANTMTPCNFAHEDHKNISSDSVFGKNESPIVSLDKNSRVSINLMEFSRDSNQPDTSKNSSSVEMISTDHIACTDGDHNLTNQNIADVFSISPFDKTVDINETSVNHDNVKFEEKVVDVSSVLTSDQNVGIDEKSVDCSNVKFEENIVDGILASDQIIGVNEKSVDHGNVELEVKIVDVSSILVFDKNDSVNEKSVNQDNEKFEEKVVDVSSILVSDKNDSVNEKSVNQDNEKFEEKIADVSSILVSDKNDSVNEKSVNQDNEMFEEKITDVSNILVSDKNNSVNEKSVNQDNEKFEEKIADVSSILASDMNVNDKSCDELSTMFKNLQVVDIQNGQLISPLVKTEKSPLLSKVEKSFDKNLLKNKSPISTRNMKTNEDVTPTRKKAGKWDAITEKINESLARSKSPKPKNPVASRLNLAVCHSTPKSPPRKSSLFNWPTRKENAKPGDGKVGKNTSDSLKSTNDKPKVQTKAVDRPTRILSQLQNVNDVSKKPLEVKATAARKKGFVTKFQPQMPSPCDSTGTSISVPSSSKIAMFKNKPAVPKAQNSINNKTMVVPAPKTTLRKTKETDSKEDVKKNIGIPILAQARSQKQPPLSFLPKLKKAK